jgi:hypothetical protein
VFCLSFNYSGGKFISIGDKIRLPDDVTMVNSCHTCLKKTYFFFAIFTSLSVFIHLGLYCWASSQQTAVSGRRVPFASRTNEVSQTIAACRPSTILFYLSKFQKNLRSLLFLNSRLLSVTLIMALKWTYWVWMVSTIKLTPIDFYLFIVICIPISVSVLDKTS